MKTRLSIIVLLLCTLFFACKKNGLQIEDSNKVSASEANNSTVGDPLNINGPIGSSSQDHLIDLPSLHSFFNCANFPSDIPFFINIGMFEKEPNNDHNILIEYEKNPNYTGNETISSIEWDFWRSVGPTFDTGIWGLYDKDSLFITIPNTPYDVKLNISGIGTTVQGNSYSFEFYHRITKSMLVGGPHDYDHNVDKGIEVDCICQITNCGRAYTLILPLADPIPGPIL